MTNKISFQIILEKIKRQLFNLEDRFFEKQHGLKLGGIIPHESLMGDNKNSLIHATAYYAVWCRNLRELLGEVEKTGIAVHNFVDIGSGKGKACFYASKKMKFGKIIGVEFSKPIIEIAIENNKIFGRKNIEFIQADANDFILPHGNSLVFMFNPFDNVMLDKFIENNLNHFKTHGSIIAYANDIHRKSLATYGFETIFRNQTRKISLHQLS